MAKGFDPLAFLSSWGIPIVGAYYGYIMYTGKPSILGPEDPILKVLNDIKAAIYAPPQYNDNTPPTVTITNPTTPILNMAPGNITIQGAATDETSGSGVKDVKVRVNGQAWVTAMPSAPGVFAAWSLPMALNSVGSYLVEAQATDNAGNASTIISVNISVATNNPPPPTGCTLTCTAPQVLDPAACQCVTPAVDTTKPTITITSPSQGSNLSSNLVTVTGTAADNVGVVSVFVRPRKLGTTITTGYVAATPIAPGNYSQWSVNINMYSQGSAVTDVYGPDYELIARAMDAAGNATYHIIQVHCPTCLSTTPPTSCPVGQHLSNGVCVSDTTPPITDTTDPTIAIVTPSGNSTIQSPLITVSGHAADNVGVSSVYVRPRPTGTTITTGYVLATPIAPGDWSSWSVNLNLIDRGVSTSGLYDVVARAMDAAGNTAFHIIQLSCPACSGSVENPPTSTCPAGQHFSTSNNVCELNVTLDKTSYGLNDPILINATGCNPSEQVELRLRINEVSVHEILVTADTNGNASGTLTANTAGSGYVKVTALTSGVIGRQSLDISTSPTPTPTTDTIKPAIAITSPMNGTSVNDHIVTVTGTASDNTGIASVYVRPRKAGTSITTGYVLAVPVAPGDWSQWSVSLDLFKQGSAVTDVYGLDYEIVARATDLAGNQTFNIIQVHCASCAPATPPSCTLQCAAPQVLDAATCTCVTPAPSPSPTGSGPYTTSMNITTPNLGTVDDGQTVTVSNAIPPYRTLIAESNEPTQYQGDMTAAIQINNSAWVSGTRVSTSNDQWRFDLPSGLYNQGSNVIRLRFTYINGYVKTGTFNITATIAGFARAMYGRGGRMMSYRSVQKVYEDEMIIAGLR